MSLHAFLHNIKPPACHQAASAEPVKRRDSNPCQPAWKAGWRGFESRLPLFHPARRPERGGRWRRRLASKMLPATQSAVEKVRAAGKPDEVAISFGSKLSTAVGSFIAAAGAEANFCATMRCVFSFRALSFGLVSIQV